MEQGIDSVERGLSLEEEKESSKKKKPTILDECVVIASVLYHILQGWCKGKGPRFQDLKEGLDLSCWESRELIAKQEVAFYIRAGSGGVQATGGATWQTAKQYMSHSKVKKLRCLANKLGTLVLAVLRIPGANRARMIQDVFLTQLLSQMEAIQTASPRAEIWIIHVGTELRNFVQDKMQTEHDSAEQRSGAEQASKTRGRPGRVSHHLEAQIQYCNQQLRATVCLPDYQRTQNENDRPRKRNKTMPKSRELQLQRGPGARTIKVPNNVDFEQVLLLMNIGIRELQELAQPEAMSEQEEANLKQARQLILGQEQAPLYNFDLSAVDDPGKGWVDLPSWSPGSNDENNQDDLVDGGLLFEDLLGDNTTPKEGGNVAGRD